MSSVLSHPAPAWLPWLICLGPWALAGVTFWLCDSRPPDNALVQEQPGDPGGEADGGGVALAAA